MDETTVLDSATAKLDQLYAAIVEHATNFGVTLLSAIVFWMVGRWLIGFVVGLVQRSLTRQKFDPTVLRYLGSFITVTLNIVLVVAILGYCGIETTTFAALLAAVGLAIGMAWSGLLANLAAGAFIIVLRPFKVGDFVNAGGITGTVVEIGLFVTSINTEENVLSLVGNDKIFSDTIQNYSSNLFRRLEFKTTFPDSVNKDLLITELREKIARIPQALSEPHAEVRMGNSLGDEIDVTIHVYCHNEHFNTVHETVSSLIQAQQRMAGA